jgi:hypothetical protein
MREAVDAARVRAFMRELAATSRATGRVYLTGGASAVLLEWRSSTVDIDVKVLPEDDRVIRALAPLKERLHLNVELASPSDFIPELPGWQERSLFIVREGQLDFLHYDFYSQCLAKVERGHRKDRADVESMIRTGLVDPARLRRFFDVIFPELYRHPAIDPSAFRRAVEAVLLQ